MTAELKNPLEILGVPRDFVADAQSRGELGSILSLANRLYRALAQTYHDDMGIQDDDARMSELTEAIGELRNPAGLSVYVGFYLDQSDRARRDHARGTQQLRQRTDLMRDALAAALVNVDPLRVLGAEKPVRFIAGLGLYDLNRFPITQPVLIAEAWPDQLELCASAGFQDDSGIFSTTDLVGYSAKRAQWYSPLQKFDDQDRPIGPLRRFYHERIVPITGPISLIGGATVEALLREQERLYGTMPQVSLTLPRGASDSDGHAPVHDTVPDQLSWARLETAWWLPALQPTAHEGDYLALMIEGRDGHPPHFALSGPLLKVQPR